MSIKNIVYIFIYLKYKKPLLFYYFQTYMCYEKTPFLKLNVITVVDKIGEVPIFHDKQAICFKGERLIIY